MSTLLRRIIRNVLVLATCAFPHTMVHAYVLQGPHIIQMMAQKQGQAGSLFVSQRVIFHGIQPQPETLPENVRPAMGEDTADNPDTRPPLANETAASGSRAESYPEAIDVAHEPVGPRQSLDEAFVTAAESDTVQLDESIRYVFSKAFRSDIVSDLNQRVYVFNQGRTMTVIDGVISDAGESRFDLYKDLLLYRSREELSVRLSDLGIDVNVSSLGKFDGQPALVIGAEFPDESVSQVWVDKETFHPVRMIISGANSPSNRHFSGSTAALDIRYSRWQQVGSIWYPMQIEFIQDGATVREITVNDYQLNPNFSEGVFDIARLEAEYAQPVTKPAQTGENEGLSEVQKTIEEFKKIFE